MSAQLPVPLESRQRPRLARDAVTILLTGVALGLAFNVLGLASRPPHGLPWIGGAAPLGRVESAVPSDSNAGLLARDVPSPAREPEGASLAARPARTAVSSRPPLSAPGRAREEESEGPATSADLPAIPDVGRPVEVGLATVAAFVDAGAALVVDARERSAFADGHIPGAINVPYDEVARDPAPLRALEAKGRPVIVYCSGGDCEASRMLAERMVRDAGMRRVLVYEAGFPEWRAAGKPVTRAAP